jgi:hypothetical protein
VGLGIGGGSWSWRVAESVRLVLSMTCLVRAVERGMRRSANGRLLLLRLSSLSDHPVRSHQQSNTPHSDKQHAPLELATLFVRLIRHSTLKYRSEEQQPARAMVQLLVVRAVVFQDVIDYFAQDLHDFEARAAPGCEHYFACHVDLEGFEFFFARVAFKLRALDILHHLLHTQPTRSR